jgi:hypothetical protein
VRIQARRDDGGNYVLSLMPMTGSGVDLTLDDRLLHSLCRLLQNAVAKSEWEFTLTLPRASIAPESGEVRTIN